MERNWSQCLVYRINEVYNEEDKVLTFLGHPNVGIHPQTLFSVMLATKRKIQQVVKEAAAEEAEFKAKQESECDENRQEVIKNCIKNIRLGPLIKS